MGEEIFRKKSLDKVKSPESLDDYIKVSNPGVWLLLVSVIVLLVGVCVWGVFGHIDSTVPVAVRVENGTALCYVTGDNINVITVGMKVKLDGKETVIESIESIGERENSEYICMLKTDETLKDGFYDGKVVTKSYRPLSFVLN